MADILVVPKFSSRQTKGKRFELVAERPLTADALVPGSKVVELKGDLSHHTAIRWWLTPYGGVHMIQADSNSNDHLRWRKVLDSAGYPGYVVWGGQLQVGMDNGLTDGTPMNFGVYSRRPAFSDSGAQNGYHWMFSEVGVYIGKHGSGQLVIASESTMAAGSVTEEQREKHHMDVLPSQRQLAEAARSGFNRECSDALSEQNDDWRLWFLSQRHLYCTDTVFANQCRSMHWRQALRRVEQPWQLAVAIRECLQHFMVEYGQQDRFTAQGLLIEEYLRAAREHAAAQQFDSWFSSFYMYLDE